MVISAARAQPYFKHSYSVFRVCYCGFLCPSSIFNASPPFLTTSFIINLTYVTYLMLFLKFFDICLLISCDIPENALGSRDFRNEQENKSKGLMRIPEGMVVLENIRHCSVREVRGCISYRSNPWVESLVRKPWRFPWLLEEPLEARGTSVFLITDWQILSMVQVEMKTMILELHQSTIPQIFVVFPKSKSLY